jgi:transposase-like protein
MKQQEGWSEFWKRTVNEQERSGRSIRAFCRERGIAEHSFYMWRKRVRQPAPVTFALVETGRSAAPAPAWIELALVGGELLRFPCEAAALRMVLSVVREQQP